MFLFLSPRLKKPASAFIFSIPAVAFSVALSGNAVQAKARADLNSTITITTFFDGTLGPTGYTPFSNRSPAHYDNGFAIGNATSTHTSSVTNVHTHFPNGDLSSTIQTQLDLNVTADHPFGYAVAYGWAETGYRVNLASAGDVIVDIIPHIKVDAITGGLWEYAAANFHYNVTWNGQTIKWNNAGLMEQLAADLHFFSSHGVCRTISCSYTAPTPPRIILAGVQGINTLYIDPDADNDGLATAPSPISFLGAAAAFGSIRKARKFSSRLRTFSMG